MKIFIVGIVFAIVACALVKADLKEDLEKLNKICMDQSKSTPEEVSNFFGNNMSAEYATDTIKCHVKCMLEQNGHLKDGVIDEQHVLDKMKNVPALKEHQDELAAIVANCKTMKGANDCDTAYKMFTCFGETEVGKLALSAY